MFSGLFVCLSVVFMQVGPVQRKKSFNLGKIWIILWIQKQEK